MARPRKDQEGPTAVERMEEAFWEILAEKPYAQITVGEIAKRAQVNKNAFYYHFDGLGALAAQALDSMLPREMARMLLMNGGPSKGIDEIEANALLRNPDLKKRIDRALLVVGKNGSSELVATLKNLVMHTWFDLFHVDDDRIFVVEAEVSTSARHTPAICSAVLPAPYTTSDTPWRMPRWLSTVA